eukprot:4672595-Lingulodinium_polyedra.AAC.1
MPRSARQSARARSRLFFVPGEEWGSDHFQNARAGQLVKPPAEGANRLNNPAAQPGAAPEATGPPLARTHAAPGPAMPRGAAAAWHGPPLAALGDCGLANDLELDEDDAQDQQPHFLTFIGEHALARGIGDVLPPGAT